MTIYGFSFGCQGYDRACYLGLLGPVVIQGKTIYGFRSGARHYLGLTGPVVIYQECIMR